MENALFLSEEFKNKEVLIIDSEDDKLVSKEQRDEMYKLCSNAEHYRFKSVGHITMFKEFEETIKDKFKIKKTSNNKIIVQRFLKLFF